MLSFHRPRPGHYVVQSSCNAEGNASLQNCFSSVQTLHSSMAKEVKCPIQMVLQPTSQEKSKNTILLASRKLGLLQMGMVHTDALCKGMGPLAKDLSFPQVPKSPQDF